MAQTKSKIFCIGGTGYINCPAKSEVIDTFKASGVNFVLAIKQVDVVISSVDYSQLADHGKIIAAVKEAGNVKRFFPSEFGNDVDRAHAVEPAKTAFAMKAKFRRDTEAAGIPYTATHVSSNFFNGYFLRTMKQPGATAPPRDTIYNKEDDIATYTIKAVDDPRTLNKILYIRQPANTISFNERVALWEKKIEAPVPANLIPSICHSVYVKGDQTNFEVDPSVGVEASALYPDVKYTTVDEFLSQFV
ncbi:hypothetical protein ACLB2K_011774 [Fragaria x ananassa]